MAEIIVALIETSILCYFAFFYFEKWRNKFSAYIAFILTFIYLIVSPYLYMPLNIKGAIGLFFTGFVIKLTTKDKLAPQLLFIGIYFITETIIQFLLINIAYSFFGISHPILMSKSDAAFIFSLVSELLSAVALFFAFSAVKRRRVEIQKWQQWLPIILLPIISVFSLFTTANYIIQPLRLSNNILLSYIQTGIVIIANIINLYLLNKLQQNNELWNENEYLRSYFENAKQYFEAQKAQDSALLKIRHDLKHLLATGQYFLRENMMDELSDLLNSSQSSLGPAHVDTGNTIIDSILEYRISVAENMGIACNLDASLPNQLPIDAFDLFILLGNIVDNAIEACERIHDTTKILKIINISIFLFGNKLDIAVSNTYVDQIQCKNGRYLSAKRNYANGGIGMLSIQEIVDKYRGIINYSAKDNLFCADVMLTLP